MYSPGICPAKTNSVRLLDLVKFFLPLLPEVELPDESVTLDEKIVFTVASGIIFLFGQLPLYGLGPDAAMNIRDPFYLFRSVFAMEKGTLLELGLLPVITSAFLWQLAAGLRLVKVNLALRSERELFQTGQKLTSFILGMVYTAGLIASGYFAPALRNQTGLEDSFPVSTYVFIFLQVFVMSAIMTLLVEVFDKGYGFGSGILCFIALQAATDLVKNIAGLEVVKLANSNKFESVGALINLIRSFSFKTLGKNIYNSFNREHLPNLTQVYIIIGTLLVVVALQNFRIELPIRSNRARGMNNVFPIRLLYTGALPLAFAYTVLTNLQVLGYIASQLLESYSPVASSVIGKWAIDYRSSNLKVSSGILYFLSPPTSIVNTLVSPLKTAVFSFAVIVLSAWFANIWSSISGSSPKDISKQFKEQGISIAGKRDISVTKELSRVIPVASVSGATVLALIAVGGEVLGGAGKGVGVIIGVSAAFGVLEEFMMEYQQAGGNSQFSGAFGQ